MSVEELLQISIFFGLLNTSLLIILDKWGFIKQYEESKKPFFFPLSFCFFCAAFWMAFFEIHIFVLCNETKYGFFIALIPFLSASITQKLLR